MSLTRINFHFISPTGEPLARAKVQIQMPHIEYIGEADGGVVVPRNIFEQTDREGKLTLDLVSSKFYPYVVIVYDWFTRSTYRKKFYVPESDEPVGFDEIMSTYLPDKVPYIDETLKVLRDGRAYIEENVDLIIDKLDSASESLTEASQQASVVETAVSTAKGYRDQASDFADQIEAHIDSAQEAANDADASKTGAKGFFDQAQDVLDQARIDWTAAWKAAPLFFADYDEATAHDYSDVADGQAIIITDEWRGGNFYYSNKDEKARVTVDPGWGLSIPIGHWSGKDGALIRVTDKSKPLSTCWWGFKTGTDEDMRVPLQRAINYVQAIDERRTLTSPPGTALLKSTTPVPPAGYDGERHCLVITMPNRVKWVANETRLDLDSSDSSLAGIDSMLAVAPANHSDQPYWFLQGLTLSGGVWANKDDRPVNNIKATYAVMSYSVMRDVTCYYAARDNINYCGFVVEFTNVRARFAGTLGSNFKFEVNALNGDAAARTAYYLQRCIADYAGLFGYRFFGGNGHTYCHLDTCAADHSGRDDNNNTIVDNIDKAAGYGIDNVRSFVMTACGAEWCNRAINGSNTRNFTVNSLYGVNCGTTDGTAIDAFIKLTGYYEFVTMDNIENRSGKNFEYWLDMVNSDAFNYNSVTIDRSIPRSRMRMSGKESAAHTQVYTIADWYDKGMRSPGGDALLHGDPLNTNKTFNWFNQNEYGVTKNFHMRSDSDPVGFEIIELTNPNTQAYLGFFVKLYVGRTNGSTPVAPAMYSIATSAALDGTAVPIVEKVGQGGDSTIRAEWVDNKLRIILGNAYTIALAQAFAFGRPSQSTQTFQWLEPEAIEGVTVTMPEEEETAAEETPATE